MGSRKTRNMNINSNQKLKRLSMTSRRKLLIAFVVILIGMIVLGIRLLYLNKSHGAEYSKMVLDQQAYSSTTIPYKRGDITDRNGTVIATSEKVYNVILDAYVMRNSVVNEEGDCIDPTIKAIVNCFGIDETEVRSKADNNPESRYIILKKQLPYATIKAYNDYIESDNEAAKHIKGIWFEEDYVRRYPYSTMACDLIGFTNSGNMGVYGIEEYYNSTLNGTEGRSYVYFDESVESTTIPAVNGYNVVSTIDVNIQNIIEKYIKDFNEQVGSLNTAVIVMDPNNAEILGMSGYPVFDLNNPRDLSITGLYTEEQINAMTDEETINAYTSVWKNYCISDLFEPGSVVKTMTLSAALDEGIVTPEDTFYCDKGEQIEDYYIKCHTETGHFEQNTMQALMNSCNDAFMAIGLRMGAKIFTDYQHNFGFGQYTGIDLPGEASGEGLIYSADQMGPVDIATNAFGQNYNVTMVQVAAQFAAVINGGNLYRPHVVKEIRSEDGSVAQVIDKELVKTVISEKTSVWMKEALWQTVEGGTGYYAKVPGYKIGGKTGTAEKLPREDGKNLVSFIGFAPVDDPQVMVYVIVDEPKIPDQADSSIPSRICGDIMKELLPYMGVNQQ